jgi:RNase H-fold protein (predicted Holliday junction resolvase)
MKTVLAIDPGQEKCGIAVLSDEAVLHMSVIPRKHAASAVVSLCMRFSPQAIIIGNGTGSSFLADELEAKTDLPVEVVDEAYSTQKAKSRYFQDNPPRGVRRLIPRGLLTPPRPYDDYVALILAESHLAQ